MADQTQAAEASVSKVCEGCAAFKTFQGKCWFYWEGKKECSQFRSSETGLPTFRTTKENFELY